MKIISHRGNLTGPNPVTENTPHQIDLCISKGYDVEIDVRLINGKFYLGHDNPTYTIPFTYLIQRKNNLWVHCKNQDALFALNNTGLNYFWHQEDDVTITSHEFIWAYPNKQKKFYNNLVILDFSKEICFSLYQKHGVYAVCADYCDTGE
jgi:hypothetical protein